jgi:hypothetical protein
MKEEHSIEKARRTPDECYQELLYGLISIHEGTINFCSVPACILAEPDKLVLLVRTDAQLWNCILLSGEWEEKDDINKEIDVHLKEARRQRDEVYQFLRHPTPEWRAVLMNNIDSFLSADMKLYQKFIGMLQKKGLGIGLWKEYKPSVEAVKRLGQGGERHGNWQRPEKPGT